LSRMAPGRPEVIPAETLAVDADLRVDAKMYRCTVVVIPTPTGPGVGRSA
jgi:hypothetical protein